MKDGYKKTNIGMIPITWEIAKLSSLAEKITDGTHKTPTYTNEGIPFLRVTDIHNPTIDWNNVKYISKEEHIELTKRCKPEKGDILYSKNGTIGIPKIIDWDREFSVFVSLCLIKIKKEGSKICPKYLEQFLKSSNCMEQIRLRAKQGTVTNLHLEEIREFDIPLPNVKEQQRIVDILSITDDQIEQIESLIEKTKDLKNGLMQRLLTKGIGHIEFKETEVGVIPKEWEVKTLGEVAKYRRGSFPQPYHLPEWYDDENGTPFVQVFDVDSNFKLKESTKQKISKLASKASVFAEKGTIVITLQGTIGRTAITQYNAYIDRTLLLFTEYLRPIDKMYFMYTLSVLFDLEKKKADGGVIKTITKETLTKFAIPLPQLNEQQKIASIISSAYNQIEQYHSKKEKLQQLKQGLMQKLLTGKLRVTV